MILFCDFSTPYYDHIATCFRGRKFTTEESFVVGCNSELRIILIIYFGIRKSYTNFVETKLQLAGVLTGERF